MNTRILQALRNIARFCSTHSATMIQAPGFVLATGIGLWGFQHQKEMEYNTQTCDQLARSVGDIVGNIKVRELREESPILRIGDSGKGGSITAVRSFYVYYYGQSLVLSDPDLKKLGEFHRALEHYLTGYGNVDIVNLGALGREFVASCSKRNAR